MIVMNRRNQKVNAMTIFINIKFGLILVKWKIRLDIQYIFSHSFGHYKYRVLMYLVSCSILS